MANTWHKCHISLSLCSWLTKTLYYYLFPLDEFVTKYLTFPLGHNVYFQFNMFKRTPVFLSKTCSICSLSPSYSITTSSNSQEYPESRHFSLLPLLPSWSKPASSLAWIVAMASLLVQWLPPLFLTIYLQQSSQEIF